MLKYIIKRLALAILILFGVSVIIYFLIRLMPVDFIQDKINQMNQGGATIPQETVDNMYKMFFDSDFNYDISKWDCKNVIHHNEIFTNSKYSYKEPMYHE